jgi:hypothetical protein
MSRTDTEERSKRLQNLVRKAPKTPTQTLAYTYALEPSEQESIRYACLTFLWHCANAAGKTLPMPDSLEWFDEHAQSIYKLPNITPNGLVLPKKETVSSYNFLHAIFAQVMSRYLDDSLISSIHFPVNIRLVDGRPNKALDSRPRGSTKLHSDIWAAEPSNSTAIFVPVLGDIKNTTVEFIEPLDFPKDFHRPLDDFDSAQHLAEGGIHYPPLFTDCDLITVDALCLHRTIKNNGGFRLSIDFRALSKTYLDSDIYKTSPRMENYIPPDRWYEIGTKTMLVPHASTHDVIDDKVTDTYAAPFNLTEL